jgi:hypothetical protein
MFYAVDVSQSWPGSQSRHLIIVWLSHNQERVVMFLSALELRNIIESSFLPKRCQCTLSPDLSMTVKVYSDRATDHLDLFVTGIDARTLNGSRQINDLITELRSDMLHRADIQTLHPDRRAL